MKIVIVGGGTAGWITAAMWIKETIGHDITVVESSKIGIIGAGEGSTGSMPWFIRDKWPDNIVNEIDFLKKTKATLKMAIRMKNWKGDGTSYYSPFHGSPTDGHPIDTAMLGSILKYGRSDYASLHSWMLDDGLTTFRKVNGRIVQGLENHSYHFDGVEVGKYFKDICVKRGVKVIDSVVDDLTFDDTEFLKSAKLANGETIEADMWFDCSGFAKVLMGKTKNKWISYKNHLPCNSAITFSDDISSKTVRFETLSETMNAGWMWKIPLQQRHGCGYVYCDEYQTYEESLAEIEAKVGKKITPLNHIKFEAGKYDKIWYKNIACIGLSGHFLEPLQATSIHISIMTASVIVYHCLKNKESLRSEYNRDSLNRLCDNMIEDSKDFIQMHYFAGRQDTPFWKFMNNGVEIAEKNKKYIDISQTRSLGLFDFAQTHGSPGYPLWCHIIDAAGLYKKDIIESELISLNRMNEAQDELKRMMKHYDKIKKELVPTEEMFKYLKA
jgi:tryptophan halogenase